MTAVAVVAGYANREKLRLKIASVYASVPPKPSQTATPSVRHATSISGDAPWALSALPECFTPVSKSTAPDLKYVLAHLPPHSVMARPPARLSYADCTIRVTGDELYVNRAADHLRIPPPARLYTGPGTLAVLRGTGGGYELRTYKVQP